MTMTALKTFVNLEVLSHTDLNAYIGAGGNLSHIFAELATGAGQLIYSTGAKAVAVLAAGTGLLHMNGAGAPTISALVDADVGGSAAIQQSKIANTGRCLAYQSAAQSLPNAVATVIDLDAVTDDPGSWFSDAGNSITVPTAGLYHVHAKVRFAASGTGLREVNILVGGSGRGTARQAGSGQNHDVEVTRHLVLAAGQVVTMSAYQDSGGALNTGSSGSVITWLEVVRLPGSG